MKCDQCSREFQSEEGYNQHMRDKHGVGKEKKEAPVAQQHKYKKKRSMKPVAYVLVVLIIIGLGYWAVSAMPQKPKVNLGSLGSTHIHQDFRAYIDGTIVDFSQPSYQLQNQYVHFEGGDGNVHHVHATGATLAYALDALRIRANASCITVGRQYCTSGDKVVKYFVNGDDNSNYLDYVMKDLDKILVYYGTDNETLMQEQINLIPDKAKNQDKTDELPSHIPR
ncbi:MAG: hypothetical protein HY513_04345 [Candidatus Aenigmarchaeota archaeon]|nr:hypothetical protein [Candidatus Aenigmarchaeota archaeon]